MSRLDELIAELCPNGVPFKKVKDTYTRLKGTSITAGKMKEIENPDGDIRVFAGGKTVIDAKEDDIPNANITRVPAVLVQSRGVIDVVYYDKPFTFKNEMWAYTCSEKASVKYLYYILKNNIQKFRDAASGMGSLPQISLPVTEEFLIPIPPLPVQYEIVKILDCFTELTAELTTELTARKKQFEYYREYFLKQCDDSPRHRLGELCDIIVGGEPPLDSLKGNNPDENHIYPIFGNGKEVYGYSSSYVVEKDAVCISSIGANTGAVYFHNGKFTPIIRLKVLIPKKKEILSERFLYHAVSTINFAPKKSSVPNMSSGDIKRAVIALPSLEKQVEIARKLDKLEAISSDVEKGIPAEIAARQKQYEYYRNRLLAFSKAEVSQ